MLSEVEVSVYKYVKVRFIDSLSVNGRGVEVDRLSVAVSETVFTGPESSGLAYLVTETVSPSDRHSVTRTGVGA